MKTKESIRMLIILWYLYFERAELLLEVPVEPGPEARTLYIGGIAIFEVKSLEFGWLLENSVLQYDYENEAIKTPFRISPYVLSKEAKARITWILISVFEKKKKIVLPVGKT